jgi:hypothetical protein
MAIAMKNELPTLNRLVSLLSGRHNSALSHLHDNLFHRPDIDNFALVYTMGKVGSTSVVRSLEAVGIFARHLQWLRPETKAFCDHWVKPNSIPNAITALNHARAYRALSNPEYAKTVKVITAIRAPIEQILSHYFHALEVGVWAWTTPGKVISAEMVAENVLRGVSHFMSLPHRTLSDLTDECSTGSPDLVMFCWMVYNYLTWFDEELKLFFPIPILDGVMTDGYQIAGNVLIVKFEELTSKGDRAIAAFAQRPQFKLLKENVGTEKPHGKLYNEVLSTIKFPKGFVDFLCDSKYTSHFYSLDERQVQKDRWIDGEYATMPAKAPLSRRRSPRWWCRAP